jgi:hypothetical protein
MNKVTSANHVKDKALPPKKIPSCYKAERDFMILKPGVLD